MVNNLKSDLRRALEDWNVVAAEALVSDDAMDNEIREQSLDLMSMVCEYLTPETEEAGPHFAQCCQDVLLHIAKKGNPKENIISLLEHLEGFKCLKLVRRVLPALSTTLLKIIDRSKSHAWCWAFDTLSCHVRTIEKPENYNVEGAERLTLDLSTTQSEIIDFLQDVATMLQPLVDVCSQCQDKDTKENSLRKKYIIKFILQVFGHPVAYLSQHPEKGKSDTPLFPRSYHPSKQLVSFISVLTTDIFKHIIEVPNNIDDKQAEEFGDINICVGVHLYLVFGEGIQIENVAQVYSHLHLLRSSSKYIATMLSTTLEFINHKALILFASLLKRIPADSLTNDTSQDPVLISLISPLTNLLIHHTTRELRSLGFSCYQMFVNLFDVECRFNMYKHLFNSLNHSGLLGWTITHFKNTLRIVFNDPDNFPSYSESKLTPIFNQLFKLKHGTMTDLIEISDELIAEINLAYYVLSRHPASLTQVDINLWNQQIQEGLKLSKAHWELELKNVDTPKPKNTSSTEPEFSLTVGEMELPEMAPEQKKNTILSALNTLDVVQFNLVPLSTKLEAKKDSD